MAFDGGTSMKTIWTSILAFLLAATLPFLRVGNASAQDIRVFLIRSPDVKAIPPDAWQTFRQAIKGSAPGVTLAPSAAYATDLVELMRYDWNPEDKLGVTQTWRFYYCPLPKADGSTRPEARSVRTILMVPGKTLADSTELSAKSLRTRFRQLLLGVEPVAPEHE